VNYVEHTSAKVELRPVRDLLNGSVFLWQRFVKFAAADRSLGIVSAMLITSVSAVGMLISKGFMLL
jgi:hypothetical protein